MSRISPEIAKAIVKMVKAMPANTGQIWKYEIWNGHIFEVRRERPGRYPWAFHFTPYGQKINALTYVCQNKTEIITRIKEVLNKSTNQSIKEEL